MKKQLLALVAALCLLTAPGCSNRTRTPPTTTKVDPDDPDSLRRVQDERRFRDQVHADLYEGRNGM